MRKMTLGMISNAIDCSVKKKNQSIQTDVNHEKVMSYCGLQKLSGCATPLLTSERIPWRGAVCTTSSKLPFQFIQAQVRNVNRRESFSTSVCHPFGVTEIDLDQPIQRRLERIYRRIRQLKAAHQTQTRERRGSSDNRREISSRKIRTMIKKMWADDGRDGNCFWRKFDGRNEEEMQRVKHRIYERK